MFINRLLYNINRFLYNIVKNKNLKKFIYNLDL